MVSNTEAQKVLLISVSGVSLPCRKTEDHHATEGHGGQRRTGSRPELRGEFRGSEGQVAEERGDIVREQQVRDGPERQRLLPEDQRRQEGRWWQLQHQPDQSERRAGQELLHPLHHRSETGLLH